MPNAPVRSWAVRPGGVRITSAAGRGARSVRELLRPSLVPGATRCSLTAAVVLLTLNAPTDAAGVTKLAWSSWPANLSGAQTWFQHAVADGAALYGVALGNALCATVP